MNETLQWINLAVSSGVLIALGRGLVLFGRILQRQDEHERRLNAMDERLEQRLERVR